LRQKADWKEKFTSTKDAQMASRAKGLPTKWVYAKVREELSVGKPGVKFEVWDKWKWNGKEKKLGTLIVSVGGLRWRPRKGRISQKSWDAVKAWFGTENSV
jgi:hypothetical protein